MKPIYKIIICMFFTLLQKWGRLNSNSFKKQRFYLVCAFILSFLLTPSFGQIYTWTDVQGVIHFSDTPHQGAKPVKLPQMQTYSAPGVDQAVEQGKEAMQPVEKKEDSVYTKVMILQPKHEETIRNNQGFVMVAVMVEPSLFPDNMIQVLLDGAAVGQPQISPLFELSGINRGSHTIGAQIVNKSGEVLASSDSITVFMQRPRVGMGSAL